MGVEESTIAVTVTEMASDKIREFLKAENKAEDSGLRVRIKAGGCSGFEYVLELDKIRESDQSFGAQHGRVIVDEISLPYLNGSTIDYLESLQGAGFDIRNPQAKGSCGCGSSFGM